MEKIFKILIFIILIINVTHSQWVAGPTLSGNWTNGSISTVSSTIAWAATNDNNPPIIYRTTNAGLSWSSRPINGLPLITVFCIFGVDANTCYVGNGYGSNASVCRTTNGGLNWTILYSTGGDSAAGFFNGIEFSRLNPSIGFAQSDPPTGAGNSFYIQLTTNGGLNWNLITPPGYTGYTAAQHSPFLIDNNFFGFGLNGGGYCEITTNGGTNWFTTYMGRNGFVSGLSFNSDKLKGIAAISNSGLSKTTNGGLNWTPISVSGIDGSFLCFCEWMPNTNAIFASGSGAGIKKSTNGGVNWFSMSTAGYTDIRHMDFIRTGVTFYGYAITGNGTTLMLLDTQIALPVKLAAFSSKTTDRDVILTWVTTQEINNKGFAIERRFRKDLTYNDWNQIGFVEGHGNTNNQQIYKYLDSKLFTGIYEYRLKQIDYNGNSEYYKLNNPNEISIGNPINFGLSQNYPNPSNPSTKIDYQLPFSGKVMLKVYDIIGREVITLVNGTQDAGYYSVIFNGNNISSGVYFYKLIAEGNSQKFSKTMKMILTK